MNSAPKKLNITVMLGGPSAEREVSLRSGAEVAKALRSLGHQVHEVDPRNEKWKLPKDTDVVFLALHGTYGEDGTVQRRLEELGVTYTGCDPEASRIGFDKFLTKQRCVAAGVPTARFLLIDSPAASWPMGWNPPVVLKPARQGSSVGLQFVERVSDWSKALAEAMRHDSQVLMEEKISGRECTVGILADEPLPLVEVRPQDGHLRLPDQVQRRHDRVFLPRAIRRGDDRAGSGGGAGRLQGDWRPRLFAGGCDRAAGRRTGGAGSEHAAGHDRDQFAAQSGSRGGNRLPGTLPADGGSGAQTRETGS